MNHHIARGIVGLAFLLGLVAPASAQRRNITEKDIFAFVWVADPQISPDGSQVAFVRVSIDEKKDAYDTAIWLAKTDGSEPPRAITSGIRDTSPRWSPDGRRLAFVAIGREGRPAAARADSPHGPMAGEAGGTVGYHRHSTRRRESGMGARRQDDRVLVDRASCRSDGGAEAGRR